MSSLASSSPRARRLVLALAALAASVAHAAAPTKLTLNENPYGPSPLAVKAIQDTNFTELFRYVGDEAAAFEKQVAAHEGVKPEQIVLGDLLEALGLQVGIDGGPGTELIYSVPGYPALVEAAVPVGGVVVAVPLDAKFENDLPAIRAKITPKTKAIFLVNPHNPTGTASDAQAFKDFVLAASKQALVIVDEAYLEFSDDYAGRTVLPLVRAGENVLIYRTFSKVYGLAAMPLGYAIAPVKVAANLRKAGVGHPRSLNRIALAAASASLRDTGFVERVRAAVAAERAKWNVVLDELKLKHTPSQANFVYFDAGRPHAAVEKALKDAGIIVARAFPPYDNWVRITIGLPEENLRAQAALRALLAK